MDVACSLNGPDMAERRRRWAALLRGTLRAREPTPNGVTMRLEARDGVERELRELAALEADCCAFARFEVVPSDGELGLEITAPSEEGVEAVRELFGA